MKSYLRVSIVSLSFSIGVGLAGAASATDYASGRATFYNTVGSSLGSSATTCGVVTIGEYEALDPAHTYAIFPAGTAVFDSMERAILASVASGAPLQASLGNPVGTCEGYRQITRMNIRH